MKKILSLLTVLTVLSVPTVNAYASSHTSSPNQSGSAIVNILSRDSVDGGTTTKSVGGGTWKYGFSGTKVFSQYDHNKLSHRSSVKNSNKDSLTRSEWKIPGDTAYKSIAQTLKGNQAFWSTRGE